MLVLRMGFMGLSLILRGDRSEYVYVAGFLVVFLGGSGEGEHGDGVGGEGEGVGFGVVGVDV